MEGSKKRVRAVLAGELPDRPPLYDLLRNDAVLSHFAGEELTFDNAEEVVFKAYEPAIDATRPMVRLPQEEGEDVLPDGRKVRRFRWTTWTEHVKYPSATAYEGVKREQMAARETAWTDELQQGLEKELSDIRSHEERLGEVFFFPAGPGVNLDAIYTEIGLEQFSQYVLENPEVIRDLMELHTAEALAWIEHLPPDHGIEGCFLGDDIAWKNGPMLDPAWFREHYFPLLNQVCESYHRKGIKVLFHSDGNLNPIMEELVSAGIDGLNPIEVLAGMDVGDLHHRYPHLFFAGAIDVSQLLPHGRPQEVRDIVRCTLDAAEGRLMVGSSTELNNDVPLENFMAMRDAVLEYRY